MKRNYLTRWHSSLYRNAFKLLTTLALGAGAALAQAGGGLPMASVGADFTWATVSEDYRIVVPQGSDAPLNLEVYSPGLNLNDYVNGRAAGGYYGDEIYGKNLPFSTTFTLSGTNGAKVLERKYDTTQKHLWERLLGAKPGAGTYNLKIASTGQGKNAFAVRVAAPYSVQASQFTVNARGVPGTDLLAAKVRVPDSLVGKRFDLTNYDADGITELELFVVSPDGVRRKLTSSENNKNATDSFQITASLVGEWTVLARVVATTKQYSNAFNFKLRAGNEPVYADLPAFIAPPDAKLLEPLEVEVVDQNGRVIPGAGYTLNGDDERQTSPTLPKGYVPVSASILSGGGTVVSPTQVRISPGAGRVRFVARQILGTLVVDTVAVLGKKRIPLEGIPVKVAGLTLKTPVTLPLSPNDYPVAPTPLPGSTTAAGVGTVVDNQTTRVTIEYRIFTNLKLEVAPNVVAPCAQTLLTASATTDFPYPIPVTLALKLPNGISSTSALESATEMQSGKPASLQIPARVCSSGTVQASLEPVGLTVDGSVRVLPPAGVTVARVTDVNKGAVRVQKSFSQDSLGYMVTLTVTVERQVENLRIVDQLPVGGSSPAVRRPNPIVQGLVNNQTTAVNWKLEGSTFNLGRVVPGTYSIIYGVFTDLAPDNVVTVPDILWDEIVK
jgi:hypothetical protein